MKPDKPGQVAKFHTPLPDENPDQLYVVLEIKEDVERPRADIEALNTGLTFPPVNTVLLDNLEVAEVDTADLVGHKVTIEKVDCTQVTGMVVEVDEQKMMPDLEEGVNGIHTNVRLTIQDENGEQHKGTIFVH